MKTADDAKLKQMEEQLATATKALVILLYS